MKVLVCGAGALGSLIGALLAEARHETILLGRPDQVRAITLDGLKISGKAYGPPRHVSVRATARTPVGFAPDVVLLAVKTQDVPSALDEHGSAFGNAPIVAIQNGLAQDELVAKTFGTDRAVSAVAAVDATYVKSGEVFCARRGSLVVGSRWGADTSQAQEVLSSAIKIVPTDNAIGARWTKLIVNLANAIPAITGLSYQQSARHPLLSRAHVRMIREGVEAAEQDGVELARLPWTSPGLLKLAATAPEGIARAVYRARVRMILGRSPAFGSTWQSLQRGKSVETEFLNGEVAKRIPGGVNARAVQLVGTTLSPDEAGRRLLA